MNSNNAPRFKWFAFNSEHGPVKTRRRLYVNGSETPFFVDTNRYHHDAKNQLWGSGMHKSGCAALIAAGSVAELKARAERLATS